MSELVESRCAHIGGYELDVYTSARAPGRIIGLEDWRNCSHSAFITNARSTPLFKKHQQHQYESASSTPRVTVHARSCIMTGISIKPEKLHSFKSFNNCIPLLTPSATQALIVYTRTLDLGSSAHSTRSRSISHTRKATLWPVIKGFFLVKESTRDTAARHRPTRITALKSDS